ncbi:hypothetical protein PAPYR_5968 [Paratrimastix pyriformis]|uniref:Wings apart-like protein C-terminal domain-containing protein n=1 Tax=Paratrimastix pyriformis TaxID=342808 RepID=A0ABQ8UGA5_9EUKA|nr:hypothetical protein PAPYR_5968 [Paratrimastix pyriformis]
MSLWDEDFDIVGSDSNQPQVTKTTTANQDDPSPAIKTTPLAPPVRRAWSSSFRATSGGPASQKPGTVSDGHDRPIGTTPPPPSTLKSPTPSPPAIKATVSLRARPTAPQASTPPPALPAKRPSTPVIPTTPVTTTPRTPAPANTNTAQPRPTPTRTPSSARLTSSYSLNETGAQRAQLDDLEFCLEGLVPAQRLAVKQRSALQVAQLCADGALALALRAHGMVTRIVSGLATTGGEALQDPYPLFFGPFFKFSTRALNIVVFYGTRGRRRHQTYRLAAATALDLLSRDPFNVALMGEAALDCLTILYGKGPRPAGSTPGSPGFSTTPPALKPAGSTAESAAQLARQIRGLHEVDATFGPFAEHLTPEHLALHALTRMASHGPHAARLQHDTTFLGALMSCLARLTESLVDNTSTCSRPGNVDSALAIATRSSGGDPVDSTSAGAALMLRSIEWLLSVLEAVASNAAEVQNPLSHMLALLRHVMDRLPALSPIQPDASSTGVPSTTTAIGVLSTTMTGVPSTTTTGVPATTTGVPSTRPESPTAAPTPLVASALRDVALAALSALTNWCHEAPQAWRVVREAAGFEVLRRVARVAAGGDVRISLRFVDGWTGDCRLITMGLLVNLTVHCAENRAAYLQTGQTPLVELAELFQRHTLAVAAADAAEDAALSTMTMAITAAPTPALSTMTMATTPAGSEPPVPPVSLSEHPESRRTVVMMGQQKQVQEKNASGGGVHLISGAPAGGAAAATAAGSAASMNLAFAALGEEHILASYAALLIGCLLKDPATAGERETISGILGGTMAPLIASIQEFSQMHEEAGLISEDMRICFREALVALRGGGLTMQ